MQRALRRPKKSLTLAAELASDDSIVLDCRHCPFEARIAGAPRPCDETKTHRTLDARGKVRVSTGRAGRPLWRSSLEPQEPALFTCPLPKTPPWCFDMIRLHGHREKGFLWARGALSDQPAAYVEAMESLDYAFMRLNRLRIEAMRERK